MLFLLVAWKAPNPPNPEYGMEINVGLESEGSGDVQPTTPVGDEGVSDESEAQPTESQPEPEVKQEETASQEEVVTDESNPVSVNQEKKEVVEEIKKEIPKEVKPKPVEQKTQEVNQEAVFTPKESTNNTTQQKTGENLSQGNDKNKTGDKGQPDGTLNTDALYSGVKGGGADGTGSSLQLEGWKWDRLPNPVFPGNERGVIVFSIEVDDEGTIIKLTPDKILSPETDKICRAEIRKLTFTQTGDNVPPISKGKITIVVKSR